MVAEPPGPHPPGPPEDLATWWAGGERIEVTLPSGGRRSIFVRDVGMGPWITAIHGFPTSSWDFEPVSRKLRVGHRILAPDLLGFGDSDKPAGHDWSAFEQADIIEALWRHFGVTETRVLAHDVGLTVALELLARHEERRLGAQLSDLTLLNGGVYTGFHRPRQIQVLLQRPVLGALIARLLNESSFSKALAEVFGPEHPAGGGRPAPALGVRGPKARRSSLPPPDQVHPGAPRERAALGGGAREKRASDPLRVGHG